MTPRARSTRFAAVAAAVATAATALGVVAWAPSASAGTVEMTLDCQAGALSAPFSLRFASRASAWVPEGGTATISIDPATQVLPAEPLPQVPVAGYRDLVFEWVASGATLTNAVLSTPGDNLGAGTPQVSVDANHVRLSVPG